MNKKMYSPIRNRKQQRAGQQHGVVLVASMLLMLIVTLLGVSSFRDIVLQEKMSSNYRAKTLTSETANSLVQDLWPALEELEAGEGLTDFRTRDRSDDYDLDVDMTATGTICFAGISVPPGSDVDNQAYLFQMTATASEPNGATSVVRQGGYIVVKEIDFVLPPTCP